MDQTTLASQAIFWSNGQRRAVTNLDCDVRLPPDFKVKETDGA